jgi:hypothetical protein
MPNSSTQHWRQNGFRVVHLDRLRPLPAAAHAAAVAADAPEHGHPLPFPGETTPEAWIDWLFDHGLSGLEDPQAPPTSYDAGLVLLDDGGQVIRVVEFADG